MGGQKGKQRNSYVMKQKYKIETIGRCVDTYCTVPSILYAWKLTRRMLERNRLPLPGGACWQSWQKLYNMFLVQSVTATSFQLQCNTHPLKNTQNFPQEVRKKKILLTFLRNVVCPRRTDTKCFRPLICSYQTLHSLYLQISP